MTGRFTPWPSGARWNAPTEFDIIIPELGTVANLRLVQRIICAVAAVLVGTTGIVTLLSSPAWHSFSGGRVMWLVVAVVLLAAALILIERRVESHASVVDAKFAQAVEAQLGVPVGPSHQISRGTVGYVWLPTGRDGPQMWEVYFYTDDPCRVTVQKYAIDSSAPAAAA